MTEAPTAPAALLDTPARVDAFLASIAGADSVAVDTEGASFHKFFDRVYLVQVATRTTAAILDPIHGGKMAALGALLEDPRVEVVIHDAAGDMRMLHADFGFNVRNIFDTRIAAQMLGIKAYGLAALLADFFQVKLSKKQQRADWSRRPLTSPMLAYAAEDTAHLFALRDRLSDELTRLDRLAWAREEFAALERAYDAPNGDSDGEDARAPAFLRIKGASALSRPALTYLRELVAWREDIARRRDEAPFRIIGNEQLLQLADDPPASVADLARVRGASPVLLADRGQELVDLVTKVRALSPDALASFPRARRPHDDAFDARVARLKAVRDAAALKLGVDPGFLGGRTLLEAIAKAEPKAVEALALVDNMRPWKVALMGDALIKAL